MKDLPKIWVLTGKSSNTSDEQNIKNISSIDQTTLWNTRPLNARIDDGPCNQEEKNWRIIEKKTFRSKFLEIYKTRTEKLSAAVLNFIVISADQDMSTDADQDTTCKCEFKAS